jgi:hypothetical protein
MVVPRGIEGEGAQKEYPLMEKPVAQGYVGSGNGIDRVGGRKNPHDVRFPLFHFPLLSTALLLMVPTTQHPKRQKLALTDVAARGHLS